MEGPAASGKSSRPSDFIRTRPAMIEDGPKCRAKEREHRPSSKLALDESNTLSTIMSWPDHQKMLVLN